MHIAIIGSGISGLTAAYLLRKEGHEIDVFEKSDHIGGHTHTMDIQIGRKDVPVDTGFSVFNTKTYPNFARLIEELDIETRPVNMSFSITSQNTHYEYGIHSWRALFAQRRNLMSAKHWTMIRDIHRFNEQAQLDLFGFELCDETSVGEYLSNNNYTDQFIEFYLVPLGCAIWSAAPQDVYNFPVRTFINYLYRNGLLDTDKKPQWLSIKGGAETYVEKLVESFADNIHTQSRITHIKRLKKGPTLVFDDATRVPFDEVILGCHAPQALALLDQPSTEESSTLGAFSYNAQDITVNSDKHVLPASKAAQASWNYLAEDHTNEHSIVTYNRSFLKFGKSGNLCNPVLNITLNANQLINPDKVFGKYTYARFLLNQQALEAQKHWEAINGINHTWYCGAYWGQGFHEDGCRSGIRVAKALGAKAFA
ncbi:D-amino acid dehydrogenase [BD1-7 clade bacterium]|uniref:D-amino acid dehydrogenase n=1 Tax=BD1-7 clade bacterium TaxID=2029982 RepID=A0A5S9PJL2_9GAMM|nr:D-amino acid dehydrogenase [BD1-7 clade bacterium]CAA0104004.1 D-amino acid dehydrogenase [BD1-7 clade bacterium]